MRKLTARKRGQILQLLCDGFSIGAVSRLTGVGHKPIYKLVKKVGCAVSEFQDRIFNNLRSKRIEISELWSFTYGLQPNPNATVAATDCWTWTSLCVETKVVPTWLIGPREGQAAMRFVADISRRLSHEVQLRAKGHQAYLEVAQTPRGKSEYAKIVKLYGKRVGGVKDNGDTQGERRRMVVGFPNERHISATMPLPRRAKVTNAYSKKVANHAGAVGLHVMYYNFCKRQRSLGQTPAMAAGVTDRVWRVADIIRVLKDWEGRRSARVSSAMAPSSHSVRRRGKAYRAKGLGGRSSPVHPGR